MHPTSKPAHESSSQTSPGSTTPAAKRTYDERAAFEEAKRNLGIVGDREQEFNRGLAILGKAYSIAMTLILVYFLLDAYHSATGKDNQSSGRCSQNLSSP